MENGKLTVDELCELLRTCESTRRVAAETIVRLLADDAPLTTAPVCADLDDFFGK